VRCLITSLEKKELKDLDGRADFYVYPFIDDNSVSFMASIRAHFDKLNLTHQLESTAPLAVFPNSDKVT